MGGRILKGTACLLVGLASVAAPAGAATITVTTTVDELNADGDCSLREGMQSANDNTSVDDCKAGKGGSKLDTIKLEGTAYDLTIPSTDEDENADGDLDYTGGGKLAIAAAGKETPEITSEVDDRVLHALGPALELNNLEIRMGDTTTLLDKAGGNVRAIGGDLTLDRVEIDVGDAGNHVGGGVYFGGGDRLRIDRSFFFANEAKGGGGLYAGGTGEVTIRRSSFIANDALDSAFATGGAIGLSAPTEITDTVISANEARAPAGVSAGGGIYTESGGLELRRSLITGNDVTEGGEGVDAGGGGMHALELAKPNKIVNSTFYDNTSDDEGAGFEGSAAISHVTFESNDAAGSGDHIDSEGDLTLRNSILAGAAAFVDLCAGDPIVSKGFSASTYDDPGCSFLDSDVFGDVGLVPGGPTDNGGRTETIDIEASSLAKNLVQKRHCKVAEGEDQRGFERPKGPRCEAGAVEHGASAP